MKNLLTIATALSTIFLFGCSTIPNVNARHSVVLSHDIEKPNNNKFLEQTAEYDTVNSVNKMFKASRGPEFYMQHPIVSFNPLEMDPLAEKPYINPPSTVEPYSYEFIGDDKCISSRDLFRKMQAVQTRIRLTIILS